MCFCEVAVPMLDGLQTAYQCPDCGVDWGLDFIEDLFDRHEVYGHLLSVLKKEEVSPRTTPA